MQTYIIYLILSILSVMIGGYVLIKYPGNPKMLFIGLVLILLSESYSTHSTTYRALDKIKPAEHNRIIKATYDHQSNSYNVIYIKNEKERALDYITPLELDSLINWLNK